MIKRILIILVITTSFLYSQTKDPDTILNKVKENFSRVKDYVVNVDIKVDINFLRIPESKATIYFKQPDKVKVKSDQFALLPKEGLNLSPLSFLRKKYTAIFSKEDTISGHKTYVIKIIPLDDNSNIILTTLWIDKNDYLIRRVESTTRVNGTFTIELKYNKNLQYPLPDQMVFSFNTDRLNIHNPLRNEIEDEAATKMKSQKVKNTTGKVFITYSNYKVNEGVPDNIFEENKK